MSCEYLKQRSKKYRKYFYCGLNKQEIELNDCCSCKDKSYKEIKKPNFKKHTRTKNTSIPMSIKEIVWNRDNGKCILCGKNVPMECACCHFIPRSQGGLGNTEKNIFTACNDCHREQDNGLNSLVLESIVENYLRSKYKDWKKEDLIYKKY